MPSKPTDSPPRPDGSQSRPIDQGFTEAELEMQDTAALKMETAKRRLDRALNALEQRVALNSERLRQSDARDVAQLRDHARQVEREKQHLVAQLQRLDAYLGTIEDGLMTPPSLPNQTQKPAADEEA